MAPAAHVVESHPVASARIARVATWVAETRVDAPTLLLAPSLEAGTRALREAARGRGATFGWSRSTLRQWTELLARPALAVAGRAPASRLSLEALAARVVHELRASSSLGRYAAVADRPGFPRALTRTFDELALAGVAPDERLEPDLRRLLAAFRRALAEAGFADRAAVLEAAIGVVRAGGLAAPGPIAALDVPVRSALEEAFVSAVGARFSIRAAVPAGDDETLGRLGRALDVRPVAHRRAGDDALARLADQLFDDEAAPATEGRSSVRLFSAPGESRECVEIARAIVREAEAGTPFDRMAIVTHAPGRYRAHVVEALRRASVPAHFGRGTLRPDPTGRALLCLLECAESGLSARAFAAYLSLGVVPADGEADGGEWEPPEDAPVPSVWSELSRAAPEDEAQDDDDEQPVVWGSLRAPWRWEQQLVEAAVIGGADRWRWRLDGREAALAAELRALEDPDGGRAARVRRDLTDLRHLRRFALPILDALAALPASTTWGGWAEALASLAQLAIRRPGRVLSVLAELAPLGPIGPVRLAEVRVVLERRLTELVARPTGRPSGRVYVASTDDVRGLSFDVVFVPGLVERSFPRRVSEDPILLDAVREAITPELPTLRTRIGEERLALRLAVGAATRAVVLSYPRLDPERGRAQVPSFYGLEVLRAVEGALPSFEALARRAESETGARLGWPAPKDPRAAIDGAEYDLAVLEALLSTPRSRTRDGAARYLLTTNPHLARALRARWARWQSPKWTQADGFVHPGEAARRALAERGLERRPYSATALEAYGACPYRFYLRAVLGLDARDEPEALETLDPRTRGELFHRAKARLHRRLVDEELLPLSELRLPRARAALDEVLEEASAELRAERAPAIERVFTDSVESVRRDLLEGLLRDAASPWRPVAAELSFGHPRPDEDPASDPEPTRLEPEGLTLRGAIDRIEERDGALRVTDFKTAATAAPEGLRIDGGRVLQPLLYARALEVLRPDARVVGGRLAYATREGGFEERAVPLDDESRAVLAQVVSTVRVSFAEGFFPPAPADGACAHCDYRAVCGPHAERRVATKMQKGGLGGLAALRRSR